MRSLFVKMEERHEGDVAIASFDTLGEATSAVSYIAGFMDCACDPFGDGVNSEAEKEIRVSAVEGRITLFCSREFANELLEQGLV